MYARRSKELEIPPSHKDVWRQPGYGSVPTLLQDTADGCLIMKLAEKHCAIDFLILDGTRVGKGGKRLYFMQVSAQADTERGTENRCGAIMTKFQQLQNKTPVTHYAQALSVKPADCFCVRYICKLHSCWGQGVKHHGRVQSVAVRPKHHPTLIVRQSQHYQSTCAVKDHSGTGTNVAVSVLITPY